MSNRLFKFRGRSNVGVDKVEIISESEASIFFKNDSQRKESQSVVFKDSFEEAFNWIVEKLEEDINQYKLWKEKALKKLEIVNSHTEESLKVDEDFNCGDILQYRTNSAAIDKVYANRETSKSLFFSNSRFNKQGKFYSFFNTFDEAKNHLVDNLEREVSKHDRFLQNSIEFLNKVKESTEETCNIVLLDD